MNLKEFSNLKIGDIVLLTDGSSRSIKTIFPKMQKVYFNDGYRCYKSTIVRRIET